LGQSFGPSAVLVFLQPERPRYRIPLESVRQFEEQTRAAAASESPAAPAPSRRRKRTPDTPTRRTYF
jgi:hypothetical protein